MEINNTELFTSVHNQMLNCETDVLKGVLKQCLKRDDVYPEDAKRLTKGIMPIGTLTPDGDIFYLLAFDDVQIGKVIFRMRPFDGNISVTFEPLEKWK